MRHGTTLVELVVTLAILGLMAGITGLAIHSLTPREDTSIGHEISQARAVSLEEGRAVRLVIDSLGATGPRVMLFLPDGRVMGDTMAGSQ